MNETTLLYILVMAGVTYLIRALPLVLIRGEITNTFIRSFLHYVPYVTLSLMIFPAVLSSTQHPESASAGVCAAILLALTFVLPACAPRKENTTPHLTAQVKHVRQAQPLEQRYGIIVVEPVAITVDMARQYPQAARSCQSSAIRTLQDGKYARAMVVAPLLLNSGRPHYQSVAGRTGTWQLRI